MRQRELFGITTKIASDIMDCLQQTTGRRIWRLKDADRFKLYRLWQWSVKYKVPLEYILPVLVGYFTKGVERRTGSKSKGLGVSISVLTGNVAEEILQRNIEKDFREHEHLSMWQEAECERIFTIIDSDDFPVRIKSTLAYRSINAATKALISGIEARRDHYDKIATKLSKIPFRDNPFR